MTRLWETPGPGRRLPIRIKRHSRFVGGHTITVLGTRWSRTFGILLPGTRLTASGSPEWLGGMSWNVLRGPGRVAICKWRYR